jgi:hypothetical protein
VKSAELPFQIPAGDFQQETRKDDRLVNAMNGLLELRLNRHQCLASHPGCDLRGPIHSGDGAALINRLISHTAPR